MVVIVAWAVRPDLLGVTSFVRASFLTGAAYPLLLHFFHSDALDLDRLLQLWVKLALALFNPLLEGDRLVVVADGLKVSKEGRNMPGVSVPVYPPDEREPAQSVLQAPDSRRLTGALTSAWNGSMRGANWQQDETIQGPSYRFDATAERGASARPRVDPAGHTGRFAATACALPSLRSA